MRAPVYVFCSFVLTFNHNFFLCSCGVFMEECQLLLYFCYFRSCIASKCDMCFVSRMRIACRFPFFNSFILSRFGFSSRWNGRSVGNNLNLHLINNEMNDYMKLTRIFFFCSFFILMLVVNFLFFPLSFSSSVLTPTARECIQLGARMRSREFVFIKHTAE